MSSGHVSAAVRARLAASWTTTPIVADTWLLDDDAPPPAGVAQWVAVDFPGAVEDQVTVGAPGDNLFRETGIFQIHVFGLAGNGETKLKEYADQLRAVFRAATFDGIRCWGADPASVGEGHEDGRWLRATFAVEYQYDLRS